METTNLGQFHGLTHALAHQTPLMNPIPQLPIVPHPGPPLNQAPSIPSYMQPSNQPTYLQQPQVPSYLQIFEASIAQQGPYAMHPIYLQNVVST